MRSRIYLSLAKVPRAQADGNMQATQASPVPWMSWKSLGGFPGGGRGEASGSWEGLEVSWKYGVARGGEACLDFMCMRTVRDDCNIVVGAACRQERRSILCHLVGTFGQRLIPLKSHAEVRDDPLSIIE